MSHATMCTRRIGKKKSYRIWLDQVDWDALNFIVLKYNARSRATATRVAIRMVATHLGHDMGAFEALEAPKGL